MSSFPPQCQNDCHLIFSFIVIASVLNLALLVLQELKAGPEEIFPSNMMWAIVRRPGLHETP